jgi:hypothetical protein
MNPYIVYKYQPPTSGSRKSIIPQYIVGGGPRTQRMQASARSRSSVLTWSSNYFQVLVAGGALTASLSVLLHFLATRQFPTRFQLELRASHPSSNVIWLCASALCLHVLHS